MKVKVMIELTQEEMNEVKDTIQKYNTGLTPEELIVERIDTDLWDYLDLAKSTIKVVG